MSITLRLILASFLLASLPGTYAATSDIAGLLRSGNVQVLEARLSSIQRQFESGTLSEYALRDAYRPFYDLNKAEEATLLDWVAASPNSYVARLALGVYYKRRGGAARGHDYLSKTPRENVAKMNEFMAASVRELNASLTLTAKPYLSIFHLIGAEGMATDRDASPSLLLQANRMLPGNSLVRNRHLIYLFPRWGGSFEAVDQFIAQTKREGAPRQVLMQLEAIVYSERGLIFEERGRRAEAMDSYEKALRLGATVGGTFSKDFLSRGREHLCTDNSSKPYCK